MKKLLLAASAALGVGIAFVLARVADDDRVIRSIQKS
jgi:hypothetical protein